MAAVDFYLKFDPEIKGESTSKKDHIDIDAWSWGENNTGTMGKGGGGGAGAAVKGDVLFSTKCGIHSPDIFKKCANGEHIKKATLICRKAGKTPLEFLKITFEELIISSFRTGGSESSDVLPLDHFSLNFTKMKYEFTPQKPDGTGGSTIEAEYNFGKLE